MPAKVVGTLGPVFDPFDKGLGPKAGPTPAPEARPGDTTEIRIYISTVGRAHIALQDVRAVWSPSVPGDGHKVRLLADFKPVRLFSRRPDHLATVPGPSLAEQRPKLDPIRVLPGTNPPQTPLLSGSLEGAKS